jgi:hypothetical protein
VRRAPGFASEQAMAESVGAWLRRRGFRVYRDPDGSDYFDLIARKEGSIGLIELKRRGVRAVLGQALRRRPYGDWVAVALPSDRAARNARALASGPRSGRIGIWVATGPVVDELRPARPMWEDLASRPFPEARERLARLLDAVDAGTIPAGVLWSPGRPSSRRGGSREFRLDEFPDGSG